MKLFDPATIARASDKLSLPKLATYHRDLEIHGKSQDKALGRVRWLQGDALLKARD